MPSGGKRQGAGPKSKPPELKYKKVIISLPPQLAILLQTHGRKSQLIQRLLKEYFERIEQC